MVYISPLVETPIHHLSNNQAFEFNCYSAAQSLKREDDEARVCGVAGGVGC